MRIPSTFSLAPSWRWGFLIALLVAARAAEGGFDAPEEFSSPRPVTYEVAVGDLRWRTSGPFVGWTKNFRENPIPYRIALTSVTVSHPLTALGAKPKWRNFDFLNSVVWSAITRGPENHWGGVVTGLRYHQALPARLHSSLFVSFQGGVGAIDSSGQRYAQETDLTFTYLAAVGVRTQLTRTWALQLQVLGQHISNGWQTHPSEGIDCSGLSIAIAYRPSRRN